MKTIILNEQATDWLIDHLNEHLDFGEERLTLIGYSETSKGIMRYIISKLTTEE